MTSLLIRPTRAWMTLVFIGVLLAVIALPTSLSRGQDETATPTEEEPPTATLLPTATETLVPTDTPSPTATWTETPALTETPLPTASPTETESPTPTETTTATETPTPAATETPPPTLTETNTPAVGSPTASPAATATVAPPVGPAVLLSDTAETDTGWWRIDGTWGRSNVEMAYAGEWVFSDSPGVPYAAGSVGALTLAQPLSLPPNSQIQLRYWQRLDLGARDSAYVQVSADGLNWLTVASDTAIRNLAWTARTVRLDGYAGQSIWLRFALIADDDALTVGDGWWLDDMTVTSQPWPVTPLYGLDALESDTAALWLTEGSWRATGALTYSGGTAWTVMPQPETAVALTLDVDVNIALLTQPELRFWQLLDLAAGGDNAQVQVSADGGQSWLSLALYSAVHNTSAWSEQAMDLSSYSGQTIRVRFLLITDGDGMYGTGWTVDGIALQSASAVTPTPSVTPTPTAEIALPTPTVESAGWTLYADTDPFLVYGHGTWQTFAVAAATGGTLTATADTGATLTARFAGTGIRVIYSKGPEGRSFAGQVDEFPAQVADGYGETYSYGHALTFEALPDGQHTLTVTNGDGAMWIEAVEVQGILIEQLTATPTPTLTAESSWTTYTDTDPLLVYGNGNWKAFQVADAVGGSLTGTANPGATLTVYFEGTGIRVLHSKGPEGGLFEARVDDDLVQTGDTFDASYTYGHMVAFEGLPEGQHILVVTNGNGAIWIEAVEVAGVLLAPPEAIATPTETLEATPEVTANVSPSGREVQTGYFTVNTTDDTGDANTGDGACDTDLSTEGDQCSLRAAIEQANATAGLDTIRFNIPGTGVKTITPACCGLPTITDPVIIDGYTQPGAAPATDSTPATLLIELDGSIAADYGGGYYGGVAGLTITAGSSTVRGLVINRFSHSGYGISLSGSGGNVIQGNYLGTDVTGTIDLGNWRGVNIDNAPNNTIGGTTAGARNVISGNAEDGIFIWGSQSSGNLVQGNYIGTNAAGSAALGNGSTGVHIGEVSNNTIGGTTAGARNLISGNGSGDVYGSGGVYIFASDEFKSSATGNLVQGNYIGTDATGTVDLGNTGSGVFLNNSSNSTIGGAGIGEGNIIAFNDLGIYVTYGTGNRILSNSIFSNSALGIDLGGDGVTANDAGDADIGPNNLQNYPFLSSVTPSGGDLVITGTLNSAASATFRVEFFANAACDPSEFGEGQTFFGSTDVTTDGSGNAGFTVMLPAPARQFITATATDPAGNTSEFSLCAEVGVPASTTVTNTNDSEPGSLRRAIYVSNASVGVLDTIAFNIPGPGPHTITPLSPLPSITDPVIIDGYTQPGAAPATDATPATLLIELSGGVSNSVGLRITAGGSTVKGLVINRFNGDGIELNTSGGNVIQGNYIGTDVTGTVGLGNRNGVYISASNNAIGGTAPGEANIIAFNSNTGVIVVGVVGGTGNRILSNSIFSNNELGIDLEWNGVTANDLGDGDTGANNLQNYPILSSLTPSGGDIVITGTLDSTASTTFRIEFFSNAVCDPSAYGQGERFIGFTKVTTDGSGNASFTVTLPAPAGPFISATATDPAGNTSEFSACIPSVTVTNTNDSGPGSLRQAILNSNASVGVQDTIKFNIPGYGPHTIILLSPLPDITDPVIIDGTTQSGYVGVPLIELNGTSAGAGADGLHITAGNTTVKSLIINRFSDDAIELAVNGGNVIQGNYLGTNATGSVDLGNALGVYINDTSNNTVGGTTAATRNVISGNNYGGIQIVYAGATGNLVQGNYIGTNAAGTAALGNGGPVDDFYRPGVLIYMAPNNMIGGTAAGARNVITSSAGEGVLIWGNGASGNQIQGNYIGTNASGSGDLGNSVSGVYIVNAPNNVIGGTTVGARNVISGNGQLGIVIEGAGATGNLVQGNYIGTNAAGTGGLANTYGGVNIANSSNNTIGGVNGGEGNVIAYNTNSIGVLIATMTGYTGTGNAILSNSIFSNGTLGIDLYPPYGVTPNDLGDADKGTNNQQNYPGLSSVTAVGGDIAISGTINSRPNRAFRVELFANTSCDDSGYGEGQIFLGFTNVMTNSVGNATFFMTFPAPSGAFITATATDSSNNTSEFSKCKAIALPAPVSAAPTLISPANGTLTNDNTPTFVWGAVTNATSYELQVATNSTFSNIVYTASGAYIAHTPDVPLGDGLLYWRVRGLSSAGNGPWSTARTITVDTIPLAVAATVNTPANLAVVTTARPAFTWTAVSGAGRYRLQADDDPGFGSPAVNVVVTGTGYTIPSTSPVLPQGMYSWHVLAIDRAGNEGTNWSIAPQFTVNIQTAPANNTCTTDTTPTFTWKGVAGATGYQLQLATDSAFSSPVNGYPRALGAVTTYTPTAPLAHGTYYWRVLVNAETPVDLVYRKLTITPPLPAAPSLITPLAGAQTNDNTPEFAWNATVSTAGSPFTYDLQVDNDVYFRSPEVNAVGLSDTFYTPLTPLADGRYYWRVRTVNYLNVAGAWSAARSFRVDTLPPVAPTLNLPADNATVSASRPTLYWYAVATATLYHLQVDDDSGFTDPLVIDVQTPYTYATASASLRQGVYFWRVQARDAAGNWGDFSPERTFTVNIQLSPADHAFTTDTTPTFTWSAWKGASRYQLQVYSVATPDCSSPALAVEYPTPNASVLSYTPSTPLGEGMYCWRVNVEAGGSFVVSPFYRTLTVTPPRAAAPALAWPDGGALLTDNTPELRWTATTSTAGSPFSYQVQIDDDLYFTNPPPPIAVDGLTYTPASLADGRYYWRVRAINYLGFAGRWSAARSFRVDTTPPAAPVLSAPADGATRTTARPTFSWLASATARRYRIELSTEPAFGFPLSAEVTTTSFVPSSPLLYTTYYWRVRALDAAGNISAWSAVRSVQIVSPITAVPLLNRFATSTPTLTWGPISWTYPGGHYQVQVDDSVYFTSPEYQNMNIASGTQSVVIDPLHNGTWHWRVRACTATGACGTWSTTGTFTIEA